MSDDELITLRARVRELEQATLLQNERYSRLEESRYRAFNDIAALTQAHQQAVEALAEGIPRYIEMFEALELGDPAHSVWIQKAQAVLATHKETGEDQR